MADGSDEPHVVEPMVALARDGADVVSASRYMRGGHQIGGPPLKRLMSRVAGLTLHWFAGVPTHDPTNNFKLYTRRFLDAMTIESTAGFELALELTVKATIAGRRVAEVPTTWRDRTAGQSNFKLRKWLPHYLHWYRVAFVARLTAAEPAVSVIERSRAALRAVGLPAWFLAIDLLWIANPETFAIDARHYQRATTAWLTGQPMGRDGVGFRSRQDRTRSCCMRRRASFRCPSRRRSGWRSESPPPCGPSGELDVPIWWIAFPPLAHAVWNGNPQSVVVALLVAGGMVAAVAAVGLKLYVGLTLVFRPGTVVVAGLVIAASTLIVPWQQYLAASGEISAHVATVMERQRLAHPNADRPDLGGVVDPATLGRAVVRGPGHLAGTQFYYVSTVLPAVVKKPLAAAALALPVPLMARSWSWPSPFRSCVRSSQSRSRRPIVAGRHRPQMVHRQVGARYFDRSDRPSIFAERRPASAPDRLDCPW